jgi:hypothetical protein
MSGEELEQLVNGSASLQDAIAKLSQSQQAEGHSDDQLSKEESPVQPVEFIPNNNTITTDSSSIEIIQSALQKQQVKDSEKMSPSIESITKPDGFDFKDPLELLLLLDDDVATGVVKLHPWQIQFMMDFAMEAWNQDLPFQSILRAANGSGKDKYIIAACSVWLAMRYCMARCVITSSSGVQLDNQTDVYIDQLCKAANKKIHPNIWKCNYRYYECLPTQSPMLLFATDEPGKAEGYHPIRYGAKLALFESEAKTVPDEIHNAQSRCTGYTHRCLVSSPGLRLGHFYDLDQTSVDRKQIKNFQQITASDYVRYHVTAYDCSHIPRSDIERGKKNLPGGEQGAAFQSQYLAEFGTTDEQVVIPSTYIWRAYNNTPRDGWVKERYNTGGLDLSDGGDETVLTVRNGNKHLATLPFRFDNTEDTVEHLNDLFRKWELTDPQALIFADCGGIGKPMLDRLKRQGWSNIRYVDNRHKAYQPKIYKNRNSEVWFHSRVLFERGEISLIKDDKLIKQLSGRYYKVLDGRVHQLLTKLEQKSKGYPSPDRADSFILCFWNYKSTYVETREILNPPFELLKIPETKGDFDLRTWAKENGTNRIPNPSRNLNLNQLQKAVADYNRRIVVASPNNLN